MRIPKRYGQSKTSNCPFCGAMATAKNEQGLDVCRSHTHSKMQEFKCTCGSWLEMRNGKFGPYFNCINCGNMNLRKGMEVKAVTDSVTPKESVETVVEKPRPLVGKKKEPREITITTDDVEYF